MNATHPARIPPPISQQKLRTSTFSAAAASFLLVVLLPHSSFAICDTPNDAPLKSLEGSFPFNGAENLYESIVLETPDPDILKFRYCIQNNHSHTIVYVQWGPDGDFYFDNAVAPRFSKPSEYESISGYSFDDVADLRFGEHKKQWHDILQRDTIVEASFQSNHENMLVLAQFAPLSIKEAMQEPKLLRFYLERYDSISLTSSSIFTVPVSPEVRERILLGKYGEYESQDFLELDFSIVSKLNLQNDTPSLTQAVFFQILNYQDIRPETSHQQYYIRIITEDPAIFSGVPGIITDRGIKLPIASHPEIIQLFETQVEIPESSTRQTNGRLQIIDESGSSFGSLRFTFIALG